MNESLNLEEAREAEWDGHNWVALQRQMAAPRRLVPGSLPEWFTDEIPAPRFAVGQVIRYKTLGGPYVTGTVRYVRYNLSRQPIYRHHIYLVGHAQAHLSDVPDEKCYDISTP